MYQQRQAQQADKAALQYAQLSPMEQANFAIGRGAYQLAGALGGQDPQLQLISNRNAIAKQIDYNSPESMMQGVNALTQAGDTVGAMQLADVARKMQSEMAQRFQRTAAGQASLAQATREQRPQDPLAKAKRAGEIAVELRNPNLAADKRAGLEAELATLRPEKATDEAIARSARVGQLTEQLLNPNLTTSARANLQAQLDSLKPAPPKLTADERYLTVLQSAEQLAREGKPVGPDLLSQANMAAQMLSKPRSYFDQASGQMVTVPATDPSKSFPNVFKLFGATPVTAAEGGAAAPTAPTAPLQPAAPTPGAVTTTQVTAGNLPSTSQKRIGEIDASLTKLDSSGPELAGFIDLVKTGKVKYDATSNVIDFIGSVVPPAFGLKEFGSQVDKDRIDRALTERINTLLLMAKGTQTEGDAERARAQIASYTTRFSPERMRAAIESLVKAEEKLKKELGAERSTLLGQGRPSPAAAPRTAAPAAAATAAPKAAAPAATQMSDEDKIKRFIEHNGNKPTREEAVRFLRSRGLITGG